jgi:spore coat polysaccharide biosynthesis protein SpsF
MIAVFLQARLDSSRLPRKALLPLGEKTVIEHAMEALKQVKADVYALLTDYKSYEELAPFAAECDFDIFPGPEEDVLERFDLAVRSYGPQTIIRATGDNPLTSPRLAGRIVEVHCKNKSDYSGFLGMPLGTGVEVLDRDALLTAAAEAADPYEREHVSPFLYRRPGRFTIIRPTVEQKLLLQEAEVTLDTWEDYALLSRIFKDLYNCGPIEVPELVRWLKQNQHTKQNQHVYL